VKSSPTTNDSRTPRLAVLISGSGRTLASLVDRVRAGTLDAEIVAVVSSRAGVRGTEIAREAGIPNAVIERKSFPDDASFSHAIYGFLAQFDPDLIVCAGFLKRLAVTPEWEERILNIHPGLIPESDAAGLGFYGDRVHAAVIESGATVSGATVHVVDDEYDHGPVVMKETVPVLPGDTPADLAARVFALELELYPRAIARYLAQHPELINRPAVEAER
jgi:phosphoribosylglycinamide formyltransferase 1